MATTLPKDDLELHDAFGITLSIETFSEYIIDISELIYNNELSRNNILTVLKK